MKFRIIAFVLLGFHSLAQAGLFDDEEARRAILDLRQKVESQNQIHEKRALGLVSDVQAARDEIAILKKGLLDLQNLIEQSRGELAKQTGQNEQLAKEVSDMQRRQRDLVQGVDDRMRKLEPVKVSPDGKEFLADPAEVREFEAAMILFRKGEFKSSAQAHMDFLRRYPQSGYQALGLFWLANAQYANRDYREAVINFKSSIDSNPSSVKAPEAMLAMANCQIELKDTRAARKTLEDLVKAYPLAEASVAAKDRLSRLK
jgi:tol-pal system protein YbgF